MILSKEYTIMYFIYINMKKGGANMKLLSIIANKVVASVKKSNYNCSPAGFYKPQK